MRILTRPAQSGDLDSLVGLLEVLFSIEEDFEVDCDKQRRGLQLLLEAANAVVLVAEANGQVAGMCTGQILISTAEGAPAVLVEDVVVLPTFRGHGIGRKLLHALGEWAEGQGAARLQLLADRGNHPALQFYAALGWQETQLICLRNRHSFHSPSTSR